MTAGQDATSGAAALLTAFSGLLGVDQDAVRQAQIAMADAMGVGVEHQALLDQQWAIMRAAADAVGGEEIAPGSAIAPGPSSEYLAQARACFDVALEAVQALNEAANSESDPPLDQVVRRFRAELFRICSEYNN